MAGTMKEIPILWFETTLNEDAKKKVEAALAGTGIKYVDGVKAPIIVTAVLREHKDI